MHRIALTALLFCCSCSRETEQIAAPAPGQETIVIDYALPAFGGKLLGTDRGEFVGRLLFKDDADRLQILLNENVHGIIENSTGIYAFTGLSHLSINDGFIYVVAKSSTGQPEVKLLGRLPGAPSQINKLGDGTTTFLVFAGFKGGHPYFECYSLAGNIVSRSNACVPSKPLGANNSFKPKPLRGSA